MISKISRAMGFISELEELLTEKRPFKYVWEFNARTGENSTYAEKDEAVVIEAASIAADAIHNLRTALDHAYWQIVSPFATNAKEERAIQFPFSETKARMEDGIKNRLANRVSQKFFDELVAINPHGELGGNSLLYAVHHFDGVDKHRKPIPLGEYKLVKFSEVAKQVDGFPGSLFGELRAGMNHRDIAWQTFAMPWVSEHYIFKKELKVPVQTIFDMGHGHRAPMSETLRSMALEVESTILRIQNASK